MRVSEKYLSEVEDGKIVLFDFGDGSLIGIKGTTTGDHYFGSGAGDDPLAIVTTLRAAAAGHQGPFVYQDRVGFRVVVLDQEWDFEFSPTAIVPSSQHDAPIGSLLIKDDVLLVANSERRLCHVTRNGNLMRFERNGPHVTEWSLVMKNANNWFQRVELPGSGEQSSSG
ncbi:MAG: hypothetical protein QNJ14_00940 [Woeseiaceae bacterium]|nr:hypothetical protein [Woeseiaceae bacterium]